MSTLRTDVPVEDLYRALFERAGDSVLLLEPTSDSALAIVDANEAAVRAHGYAREELIGQPLACIDPFTPPEQIVAGLTRLRAGESVVLSVRHRRKDGSVFHAEVHSSLVDVGGRRLILSVERDISERQQAEERLRHMQRLMAYVISHARSAIAVHDRDLRYIYVSERYLKEYGVAEQDVIGRHHYEVFPDLPQKWRDVHQRALRGEVSSAEEDPYSRADGSLEWTRWECRPWYESDGSIGGFIVYTEVITDRKRAEAEKQALQAQLQQAMKMEAVGRLAGGIAHDFNNLLTGITGNVDLALMDLRPEDPLAEMLRDVASAAGSAASLTRQLLAFSRKQIIEPRATNLNDLLANLQRMLVRVIGEDISLQMCAGADLATVRVDPGQFEQVVLNLAVNARDAMPTGGRLVLETRNVELDAEYCARHAEVDPGRYVMLAVSDTGGGMTDEVKQHLFEPFFTTKGLGRGTGLGLATIFGAVKQAGGSIQAYSEVGRGTTFRIYLPAIEATPRPLPRVAASAGVPNGHETILLVEDDEGVRRLAARVLSRLGYTLIEAGSGEEALEQLRQHSGPLHLLITDVVMPGMNGRELATEVTRQRPATRVLYASGYTENVIVHHGVLHENLSFIAKPYSAQDLGKKVRDVLDT